MDFLKEIFSFLGLNSNFTVLVHFSDQVFAILEKKSWNTLGFFNENKYVFST